MDLPNKIRVSCDTKHYLNLDELEPLQGKLKDLPEDRYAKLRKSILKEGFCAPMFVWYLNGKKFILDGHQRRKALLRMRDDEGFEVPRLPVVPIQATDLKEAKGKVLAFVSQYGKVTGDGLHEFLGGDADLIGSLDDHQIPDLDMPSFRAEFLDGEVPNDKAPDDGASELDRKTFTKFSQQCPKCGFSFGDEKKTDAPAA